MKKAHMALTGLLTFAVMAAWLNVSHILDAIVRVQPSISPLLAVEGIRLVPKGLYGPIEEPVLGLLFSAAIALTLAFRNLVVSDRPWLRMGMFLSLIVSVIVCWFLFGLTLSFVNPSDVSDPEIAEIAKSGFLSLRISFVRGGVPATASFAVLLSVYTVLLSVLSYPISKKRSLS